MLPEDARLDEVEEPDAEEPRTAVEVEREAEDAARVAVETLREAAGTARLAVELVREAAEPAAEGAVRDATAMRPEDFCAAEPEAAAELPAVRPVPVRTTRPTPLRGLPGMKVPWSLLVASSWP